MPPASVQNIPATEETRPWPSCQQQRAGSAHRRVRRRSSQATGLPGPAGPQLSGAKALQSLLNILPPAQLTEEERIEAKARWEAIRERARQYRKEHPYGPANPESRVRQEELYGENGRYGNARHPAALNFGDTFAYALASVRGLPLLFKGKDFVQTDIAATV